MLEADILWKYLKPDSRLAEDGLKANYQDYAPCALLQESPASSVQVLQ